MKRSDADAIVELMLVLASAKREATMQNAIREFHSIVAEPSARDVLGSQLEFDMLRELRRRVELAEVNLPLTSAPLILSIFQHVRNMRKAGM